MDTVRETPRPPGSGRSSARSEVIPHGRALEAIRAIETDYANASLDLRQLSRHLDMSLWHLSRLLTRATGMGFRRYVNQVRVGHACVALQTTDLSVKEIAATVGYNQLSDLTRRFKAVQGISPTEYRRRSRSSR